MLTPIDRATIGPNVRRLITVRASYLAIPPNGGLADSIALFTEPGRLAEVSRQAEAWVREALATVKAAPDNPYGADDEAIAGEILRRIEERKKVAIP